ncbi:hypothetical protein [Shinella zoogloeoides]|uniref:hypothetical protein n=1 Tax=Shinella zoogloeoides TaxID=352475 RepID=UPI001F5A5059|nr:hypothetical protein [Shinella zoogloeoides]
MKLSTPNIEGAVRYQFRGQWLTVREIMKATGWPKATVYKRRRGARVLEAAEVEEEERQRLAHAHPKAIYVELGGKRLSLSGWARELGVPYPTLYKWLRRDGLSVEQIANNMHAGYERRPKRRVAT